MKRPSLSHAWRTSLAIVVLVPFPAFALTMLGSWRYFVSTPGIASVSSTDQPNSYNLKVHMGAVPPASADKLMFTATRDFQIENASQLVSLSHAFRSMLREGRINVTVNIERFGVPNDPFNFPAYSYNAVGTQMPSLEYAKTGTLTMGMYRISITLTYILNPGANGAWNNSSPHTFVLRGY